MDSYLIPGSAVLGVSLVLGVCATRVWSKPTTPHLPPGPKGHFLFGSSFDINAADPGSSFAQWGREYGELVHVRHFGRDLMIINSERIAQDLLERRSRIYSDRVDYSPIESYGMLFNSAMINYNDAWRFHRKMMNQLMRPVAIPNYHGVMVDAAHTLVSKLKDTPEKHWAHIDGYAARNVMEVIFGRGIEQDQERLVTTFSEAATCFMESTSDVFLAMVKTFPMLKYVPTSFPGGRFNAAEAKERMNAFKSTVYGLLQESNEDNLLLQQENQDEVKNVSATAFIGVPHCVTEDDHYEGYFIPKGTVLVGNAGGMLRDPVRYPNPEKFSPERFLNEDGSLTDDDVPAAFGFGRRVCPGRYLADSSVWMAIVSMLAELDIKPAKDEEGNAIVFEPEWNHSLSSRPKPFPCSIVPRN
ncbi:cytochrome P450 [Coniophora puteana RWD-64-598 SS2]|uniref:Cytochrome P450 n=1 Tax=Coniophora puteana (strain RWD-64-598) TaxID=741705 RepID=A0A5M3N2Y9_CONPW|nr:cytochrome P450 [Coniophora puteana RWD-64-598 SS2]EIW85686.1 cytochrome P450 [Coniophora puteana RWD-64-598 SS2]